MTKDLFAEVLVDVTGLDRAFHYRVEPPGPPVGTIVRVNLHGRRVRGWVVSLTEAAPPGVEPQSIIEEVSLGPPPGVVELARWSSWRFAGRLRSLLVAASPDRVVRRLPAPRTARSPRREVPGEVARVADEALTAAQTVVILPPAAERLGLVEAALSSCPEALVLVESRRDASVLAAHLRRGGWPVALYPEEWAAAAAGGSVVVGTRNAAFAPGRFGLVVVLDAHAESYRSERSPNYDARLVAAERARREGARLLYVSFAPPLELVAGGDRPVLQAGKSQGWGALSVLDSREEDPAEGGYPSLLVSWIRSVVEQEASSGSGRPVLCILNRVGRARLLTCANCRAVSRCSRCGGAMAQLQKPAPGEVGRLSCRRCGNEEEALCSSCGSSRLRVARSGVSRAREQLEAVTGLEVGEMSGPRAEIPAAPLIMATQSGLHRLREAAMVAWLDFDQELLAPRFKAAEEALVLLGRSFRLVGRTGGAPGRVVVRTTLPAHEVLEAARLGDPSLLRREEEARRLLLGLPPFSGLARLTGSGAAGLAGRLPENLEVTTLGEGFVVRGPSPEALADAFGDLAGAEPAGWTGLDARVEMDPIDL